jgi:hypothetical protein
VQLENSRPTNSGGLKPLFTVGHSILDFEQFAKLLKDFGVELVADVRSVQQSARLPHFSQPAFEKLLGDEHISYLFFGEELGGARTTSMPIAPTGWLTIRCAANPTPSRGGWSVF